MGDNYEVVLEEIELEEVELEEAELEEADDDNENYAFNFMDVEDEIENQYVPKTNR